MKINLCQLRAKAKERPEGYVEDVIAHGTVVGQVLEITPEQYQLLLDKYNKEGKIQPSCCGSKAMPALSTQAKNALQAAGRVVGAAVTGKAVFATPEVVAARQAVCDSCEFWVKEKKRCSVCGCRTDAKLKLATESCPKSKW